jgi:multidrug efflux pump subunit AcrA (membrane-fusion protein)
LSRENKRLNGLQIDFPFWYIGRRLIARQNMRWSFSSLKFDGGGSFFVMRKLFESLGRLGLALASLAALCSYLCFSGCSKNPEKSAAASESEFAVSVKVAPVARSGIRSTIHAVGVVKALNQAKISAKIPGKVERILAEEGDGVEAGQTLLRVEKIDLVLTVRQAQAALAMAEANFSKAKTEWARAQELFEKGISSQQQYDLAKSAFEVAEATVKQAKADLGLAQNQLDNADVTTLFGGTVIHRYVDLGERVSAGQPLFEEPGYPHLQFTGRAKRIQPAMDPMTRTFKVTVGLANPEGLLKPGMFARTEIEVGHHPDALVIPKSASLEEEGKYFVVAVRDGRAHRVEIVPGFQDLDRIEVLSGLSEGEQVVTEGAYGLAQNTMVQVSGD